MKTSAPAWLPCFIGLLSPPATGATNDAAFADTALRQSVLGTWCYEQNAGIASVAMFTTYREDGTALQLIKTKFAFKQPTGVWIENRWKIQDGVLHLTPIRFRADASDAKVSMDVALRKSARIDGREMVYQLNGKERKERRVDAIPGDVQKMIDVLAKK